MTFKTFVTILYTKTESDIKRVSTIYYSVAIIYILVFIYSFFLFFSRNLMLHLNLLLNHLQILKNKRLRFELELR